MNVVPTLVTGAAATLLGPGPVGRARLAALSTTGDATRSGGPPRSALVAVAAVAAAGLTWAVVGGIGGMLPAAAAGIGVVVAIRRIGRRATGGTDAGDLAAAWDLLAVCLRAGLAVPVAVDAAATRLPGPAGEVLRRTAGLLALGADADEAWAGAAALPELAAFGRAASRSAATGAALGRTASGEAARLRAELVDLAEARAQRAAVRITAPLGLCFLPAFLVLGIAPVVIGLAGEVFSRW